MHQKARRCIYTINYMCTGIGQVHKFTVDHTKKTFTHVITFIRPDLHLSPCINHLLNYIDLRSLLILDHYKWRYSKGHITCTFAQFDNAKMIQMIQITESPCCNHSVWTIHTELESMHLIFSVQYQWLFFISPLFGSFSFCDIKWHSGLQIFVTNRCL